MNMPSLIGKLQWHTDAVNHLFYMLHCITCYMPYKS